MEDETASHFYINGFSRLTPDRLKFLVQAAIVSFVSEAVLLQLMKDARVAQTYEQLFHGMARDWLS